MTDYYDRSDEPHYDRYRPHFDPYEHRSHHKRNDFNQYGDDLCGFLGAPNITCSFVVHRKPPRSETYQHEYYVGQGCHYMMGSAGEADAYAVTTGLWVSHRNGSYEDSLEYWKFICSRYSPWRDIVKGRVFHKKDGKVYAVTVKVNSTTSSQLLQNFMVATRTSWEKPSSITTWKWLVDAGMSKTDALFNQAYLVYDKRNKKLGMFNSFCHWPFNNNISYKNFVNADPDINNDQLFTAGHKYYPCNSIWNGGVKHDDIKKLYLDKGAQKYEGPFVPLYEKANRNTVKMLNDPKVIIERFNKEKVKWLK